MKTIPFQTLMTKTALKSNHRQHHMAAMLMRGGKVVEVFTNNDHIHAEHAVLNRSWRSGADNGTMVVVRVKADGTFGMAKPCKLCVARMVNAGVKKVVYTNTTGEVEIMKLTKVEATRPARMGYHFVSTNHRKMSNDR